MALYNDSLAFNFEKVELDRDAIPHEIQAIWVSDLYIVRHYKSDKAERLSVDYRIPELNDSVNMITWDALQKMKNMLGFENRYAVELFPSEEDEIHSINHRHLWLVDKPDFGLSDDKS